MAKFQSNVPDIGVATSLTSVQVIRSVSSIHLTGSSISAELANGLTEAAYEKASKEIRILYAFCFEHVYSEDYEVRTVGMHYGYSGHNERKEYLLAETSPVSEKFGNVCKTLISDIAGLRLGEGKRRSFFNAAFIWARANELQELKLLSEAYAQYWRILDLVNERSQMSGSQVRKLLYQYDAHETQSNIFAIRVLHTMGMLKPGNIETLATLDSLRHPHAHQPSSRTSYYMEEETHLEAWTSNWFISDITKLFIIWELGLRDYYLKPRSNIYELAKRDAQVE